MESRGGEDFCVQPLAPLQSFACGTDTGSTYLGGVGGNASVCDMFNPTHQYANGRWVRNCAAAVQARQDPGAFDLYQFAGYNVSVTGAFGTVPNPEWDVGGRSAACFGPDTLPRMKAQKIDSAFWNWRPEACSLRLLVG